MHWHLQNIEEIYSSLQTGQQGLEESIAGERLEKEGLNEIEQTRKRSVAGLFLAQCKDVMIVILAAAAIISGFIGEVSDMVVVLIIIIMNAVIGFIQEFRAEKAMQALKKMTIIKAK